MALIDVRVEDRVARVTLNRPEVRNAFNDALISELTAWAERAAKDRQIRAVVLEGAGPVFCAGADLEWMSRMVANA
jgi:methylglutaconyl-CoA hydratase